MPARILVVEDNPTHRALLKQICEGFDFEVDLRENAEEALDAIMMMNLYSVIIVDIALPGMSGLDCAAQVRKFELRKNLKRTPIIALSAMDEMNLSSVSSSGIDDFISKPFDPERLRKVLLCWAYSPQSPNLKLLPRSG
jgi:CheY-like chemotaxis protein